MSLGWKRFTFFEQQGSEASLPEAVCSCSGQSLAFLGKAGGEARPGACLRGVWERWLEHPRMRAQVVVLDRSLQRVSSWQAHAGGVKHLCLLEVRAPLLRGVWLQCRRLAAGCAQRGHHGTGHADRLAAQEGAQTVLLTVGLETPRHAGSAALKAWEVGGHAAAGAPAPASTCTVRVFAQKLAEAEIVSLAAQPEKLPLVRVALCLSTGQILTLSGSCQGETGRAAQTRMARIGGAGRAQADTVDVCTALRASWRR